MNPQFEDVQRAVRLKCLDCSGNSQKLVDRCNIRDCPLFPYRSLRAMGEQKKTPKNMRQISIFDGLLAGKEAKKP